MKFQIPSGDDGVDIYEKSDKFIEIYKNMKKRFLEYHCMSK